MDTVIREIESKDYSSVAVIWRDVLGYLPVTEESVAKTYEKMMKRIISMLLISIMLFSLCACSKQEMADMTTQAHEDYSAIVWGDKVYVPYCAVSKAACGKQIGIVDGDQGDRVYEYKGYSADEWIVNAYVMDSAMLCRELNVTTIPEGLQSEYEWNHEP